MALDFVWHAGNSLLWDFIDVVHATLSEKNIFIRRLLCKVFKKKETGSRLSQCSTSPIAKNIRNLHKFGVISGDQPPEVVFEQVENVFVVDFNRSLFADDSSLLNFVFSWQFVQEIPVLAVEWVDLKEIGVLISKWVESWCNFAVLQSVMLQSALKYQNSLHSWLRQGKLQQ